ncbi:ferrichrome ABC transporter substrate-binding protein [Paenibacillus marchantiophytorum]|uniref:Ferrichrome ABC transporter substrate-binding protein n=1 Tax=Paenibacillus marchantiophytorum TaxID=1619310 RepID=A0ABQ2BR37_9BACL|nr:ABC transporter substrate-binding protein [Paenibacillus marchantiophytorum]GGI43698.1 ferrichrome ABC transporter substrate-binding protein [Paenibacillus marchantiophytorum]
MRNVMRLAVVCCILVLAGCGISQTSGGKESSKQQVIVNPNSQKVTVPINPKRIADLSGSTEELLLLGIKPIASANADYGDRKVFSPTIKDPLGKDTVNLGWYGEAISVEAVMSVEPDLIILGSLFNQEMYDQLSKIAPTVIVPHPYYEWRNRLDFLAKLLGEVDKKDKWLETYESKVAAWKKKLEPILQGESLAVIETYPKNLVVYLSTGTAELVYKDLGIKKATGIPEPEAWGGIQIALEGLSTINPDHLIFMENSENKMSDSQVWTNMKAVQKKNIYKITNVDNYNYSYTALGRMVLLDKLGQLILDKHKQS